MFTSSDTLAEVVSRCTNAGRWGNTDQLGTLNLITPDVRRRAAGLVRHGVAVSLGKDIDTRQGPVNGRPAWHVMHLEVERPYATADSVHLQVHGFATTHLDALGHMFLDGVGYNGQVQQETVTNAGLTTGAIDQMRDGIFTRGVLLDVAAAAGEDWLDADAVVTPALLESAERIADAAVCSGDAVFVHTGLERRERAVGPEDPSRRAGLNVASIEWLRSHDVAVYSGDCIEALPAPDGLLELPLHQIGIAVMGLVLLDCPTLTGLLAAVRRFGVYEFLMTCAPLCIPGGTGSPVNPLAVF